MPRSPNPEPYKPWKITLPATLAGRIEFIFLDPIHGKPRYGARNELLTRLLSQWLDSDEGRSLEAQSRAAYAARGNSMTL
jgi:hypothetical protein